MKRELRKLSIVGGLAALLCLGQAIQAYAIPITVAGSGPVTNVIESQASILDNNDAKIDDASFSNPRWAGQVYTTHAAGYVIDAITVLSRGSNHTQPRPWDGTTVTLRMYATSGPASATPVGGDLINTTGVIPTLTGGTNVDYLTFDVSSLNIPLSNATSYGFVIGNPNNPSLPGAPLASTYNLVLNSTSGSYADGLVSRFQGSYSTFGDDLVFYVQAHQAVPEPSTIVLAGIACLGLVATCIRRRRSA